MSDNITISIPAYNEEEMLEKVVNDVLFYFKELTHLDFEILIINDGSTDKTKEIAERLCKEDSHIRLFNHDKNLGFAEAQKSCLRNAKKDWIFLIPADGQVDIKEITKFFQKCENSDLILGVPYVRNDKLYRFLFSSLYYFLINIIFNIKFKNYSCCLMVRRSLIDNIKIVSNSPVAITELLVKSILCDARVCYVNISHFSREKGYAKGFKSYFNFPIIFYDLFKLYLYYRRCF